jgi:hypothetical protein
MDILTRNMQHLGASEHQSDQEKYEELVALAQLKWFSIYGTEDVVDGPMYMERFGSPKLEQQYNISSCPEELALIKHVHLHGGRKLMHSNSGGVKMGIP